MFHKILIPIFICFFISCSSDDIFSEERGKLNQARQLWNNAQIDNYTYIESKGCFCIGPYTWVVFVKNGIKEKVEYDESQADGQSYETIFDQARTIEDAFDFIESLLSEDIATLNIEYDDDYGFPTIISIDYIKDAVDDEIGYTYSNFNIIN